MPGIGGLRQQQPGRTPGGGHESRKWCKNWVEGI
jgi:hypothetical protein